MSSAFHILAAVETLLLLRVVPITPFNNHRYLQNQAASLTHTAWNQIILLRHFSDRITFVEGWTSKQESLAPKLNVKPYLCWTTQTLIARQQTWPAASPYTHLTSGLSRRLQLPKRSCIPICNSLICLLMSSSLSPPSLWSEVITCNSHSVQIKSSTNLTQTSLIFHKLLYCKIHGNSSHSYP